MLDKTSPEGFTTYNIIIMWVPINCSLFYGYYCLMSSVARFGVMAIYITLSLCKIYILRK